MRRTLRHGVGIAQTIVSDVIEVDPSVAAALGAGEPVVALESTIITHGMPYPQNLATALALEAIVRAHGATPATIAVIAGTIRVGVGGAALEALASGTNPAKISRRDLAPAVVRKITGGTTVAATMAAAEMAGIEIFATGGIGGVHRGAAETFDISADLTELATSAVTVVCAGAKSILDLAKTLEYLETHSVPVIGYGTDEFPAFFTRSSGLRVDHRFDTPGELAALIATARRLGGKTGILVVNPIPYADALPPAEIESKIAQAVADANARGIARKELTPYLLARINDLTGGASLSANIALAKHNAMLAAQTAVELARLGAPKRA